MSAQAPQGVQPPEGVQAVVPGSFDPITNGHVDLVERVARRIDHVVVGILVNPSKQGMFTIPERMDLVRASLSHLDNVEVASFEGLLVDFCGERDIGIIAKGVRGVADVEYEAQMAQMNDHIADVETIFLITSPGTAFVSSSLVKEVARLGGDISGTVPTVVEEALLDRVAAIE